MQLHADITTDSRAKVIGSKRERRNLKVCFCNLDFVHEEVVRRLLRQARDSLSDSSSIGRFFSLLHRCFF